ncbi:nucleotidyltransferase domain-containing protein [Bacillus sp. Au-Bac7]|uniref:nucleotidyltransferase domain-containing protein n=1 Tax=Bacillus sp. Au-Bac7 TaxID=2906458 RepID=UPI001E389CFF|nr:nucleotidyltransferase domain-containing protein [Bacillus sp. Au-Bac7]MCE4049120.1 nucleotidyltransferase domain-containing protein [Bacillus sp. Au-Bac7]
MTWQPKKFSTEERFEIANKILIELIKQYKQNLLSVALEGSTAKGLDGPESDLELRVVIKERESSLEAFFYKVCLLE